MNKTGQSGRLADGAPYYDGNGNGQYDSDPSSGDIPGVPGANQTIWFVTNDLNESRTNNLYGAKPLGVEMQATYWAYSQTGALGNMYFRKYKVINKSDEIFNDMYLSMWSDVDLGNATDDFAGCDTSLSLGYCYNANASDATYNPLPPPAVGYDFFQGPVVDSPGDSAIFNGKRIHGKKNLPMTSFYYFARGDLAVTDPTQGDPQGSTQFYNFFQGRIGKTGDFFVDPNTGQNTTFALSGDPQTKKGWIDGDLIGAGDRRIGMASGPFQMAPGDTQEVVVAEIIAGAIPGVDRISAIGLLKYYDQQAQLAYDNFFNLPTAPSAPDVNVVELDKKIILDWGENQSKVSETESQDSKGYKFQGYNVYQLPSASAGITEGKLIATYDLADGIGKIFDDVFDVNTGTVVKLPIRFGNDTGVKRFIDIATDELNGGVPLRNGIKYYFAVTSYNYNPDVPVSTSLENPLKIITVVPHSTDPGNGYEFAFSDTISGVAHTATSGLSDGNVYPIVVDPTKLTGLTYTVSFDTMTVSTINDTGGVESSLVDVWNVDRSDGVRVLSNQTDQNSDAQSPIIDGIQFRVIGAPLDFKGFDITSNANGPITGAECTYEITAAPTDGMGISADWYRDVALSTNGGALSGCFANGMQAAGGYYFIVAGGPTIADHEAAVGRWTRDGANFSTLIPNNYEIRWTGNGKGLWPSEFHENVTAGVYDVPFELWFLGPNLDDPSDDVRMIPVILDNEDVAGAPTFNFILDHEASGGNNDPYSDWIYFYMPADNSPGDAGYQAFVTQNPTTRDDSWTEHIARLVLMNWNQNQGDGSVDAQPEIGTTFRVRMTIPNKAGSDVFTFTAPKPTSSVEQAKADVNEINVFPNPYYGVNSEELNKYNRFVTFSHLPTKATIRIFNLAGILVKTLDENDGSRSGQFQRWDLANQSGLPVASGLYIAYIDMPELGVTRILKLAIIQEQQILDRF